MLPRVATLCHVVENGIFIDKSILIYFKAPYSFTGEDVVEFQCHGGIMVSSLILQATLNCGASLANPGEFSKRAFLNSKMDLSQIEAMAKLIESKSKLSAKLLAKQMKGEIKNFVDENRNMLVEILAYVEVNIDYAEEDLPKNLENQIHDKLKQIQEKLSHTLKVSQNRENLIQGYKVCIIGKPNVGKSSLLNAILNYERAIVSEVEGTTRDTIEEEIKIANHIIRLVDTAGIRNSSDKIEQIGIQRSKQAISQSDIIIALFDGSKNFSNEDEEIIKLCKKENKKVFYVLNKQDLKDVKKENFINISAKNDIKNLIKELEIYINSNICEDEMILISTRQVNAIKLTLNNIISSQDVLKDGELELFAFYINEAIKEISQISKPFQRTEILDSMFSNFCLGK